MSNTSLETAVEWVEWRDINWFKVERQVLKLQERIYKASQSGDVITVRKVQRLLLKSWYTKLLAVRSLTQDPQGQKTVGVEGVKALSSAEKLAKAKTLELGGKVKPRRGIVKDSALQTLVKMALEPEWEPRFEANSYGFRPGRSHQDAIEAIFNCVKLKPKYVFEAKIAKSSEGINYEQLLKKLNTYPTLRRQIRAWLKAGVMDGQELFPTEEDMAQGEAISLLLANIALHGMEERIKHYAQTLNVEPRENGISSSEVNQGQNLSLIRYASNFVIIYEDIEVLQKCLVAIAKWLSEMGLELKPGQIRIAHTLYKYGEEKPGFDFLGFNIRQYEVSKHKSKGGFRTQLEPSKESVKSHYRQIAEVIDRHKAAPQVVLIRKLNPMIRNWVSYYSTLVSKKAFRDLDHLVFQKLQRWARRRHPNKNNRWVSQKYWHSNEENNREFSCSLEDGTQVKLLKHTEVPVFNWPGTRSRALLIEEGREKSPASAFRDFQK